MTTHYVEMCPVPATGALMSLGETKQQNSGFFLWSCILSLVYNFEGPEPGGNASSISIALVVLPGEDSRDCELIETFDYSTIHKSLPFIPSIYTWKQNSIPTLYIARFITRCSITAISVAEICSGIVSSVSGHKAQPNLALTCADLSNHATFAVFVLGSHR